MSATEGYRSYAGDDVVTGEGVAVELPVASLPLRIGGALIDLVSSVLLLLLVTWVASLLTRQATEAVQRTFSILTFVVCLVVVPAVVETLSRGRSLGKLATGLRVVRDDSGPIVARHAFTRALVGIVEVYLLIGVPALVAAMLNLRVKRLGDMAAGTYAVSQRARLQLPAPPVMPPHLEAWARSADITTIPAGLAVAIRQFLARAGAVHPAARARLAHDLYAAALRHVYPPPPAGTHPELVLAAVVADRRRRDLERLGRDAGLVHRVLPADPLDGR